ncbi:disease resistance protein (TIR-NBS-LRR class), putative [Medicago truncatula]|uniref:Disease resistance protein (TIR-NBS-LRR class), putative n=1 Tax=Medicago truncatula TaxID=3880 RepID=A0A072ULH9_MEDTR|nr:disease resistance protein (TIR-NBS-LRR class), putative [Medicago truncatula]
MFSREIIFEDISDRINRVSLHVAKYPVGLQSRVQHVKLLLDEVSEDEFHMVGLYGTGGLGDVRENSTPRNLKDLQEKLLSKMVRLDIKLRSVSEGIAIIKQGLCREKILLILDDVDRLEQLEDLAEGLDWFGRGSGVIITTRDKHILTSHGIESMHAVEELHGEEALELLMWMAFKNDRVPSIYEDILTLAITYASGLPLALVIIGSNLFGNSIEEWKCTLDEYEKIFNKEIQKILRVSYDALEEKEQSIFLDMTCFFKGWKWADVKNILHDHYGHCVNYHLGKLAKKSFINITTIYPLGYIHDETLHNLIEHMGKEVVRQESRNDPGERSRLWCPDDMVQVLRENTGTSKIEMIYMNFPSMEFEIDWNGEAFKKTTKLKTLQ